MGPDDLNIVIALQSAKRIYIDTSPFIYLVEKHRHYFTKVFRVFELIESTPLQVVTSAITITELIVQPLRSGNTDLAQEYHDVLVSNNQCSLVSVTKDIAITAGAIRARYAFRTPDAIHAATAIKSGCDTILTNDRDFRRLQDINVLVLDELEV